MCENIFSHIFFRLLLLLLVVEIDVARCDERLTNASRKLISFELVVNRRQLTKKRR